MRKAVFIFCLFIGLFNKAGAQVLFSNRYTLNHPAAQFDGMVLKDSLVVTSGIVLDSDYAVKNTLSFFNQKGELLYYKKYKGTPTLNYGTFYNSFISTSDGGFAVTGYTQDTNSYMKILFMKFNSIGNIEFVKEYFDTAYIFQNGRTLLETNDGYLIGGDNSLETKPQTYNSRMHILKLNKTGELQWWKIYGTSNLDESMGEVIAYTDTNYLVGYSRNNFLVGIPPYNGQCRIMIIDTAGNKLSDWIDPDDNKLYIPASLRRAQNNALLYCGLYLYSQDLLGNLITQGHVTKLDSTFNIVWQYRTGFPSQTEFNCLRELSDGGIIAAGIQDSNTDTSHSETGWFVKLSADGDSIWSRRYESVPPANTGFNLSEIYDLGVLKDGSIIGAGISQDNATTQRQQGWLIHLDSMGCLIPGCDTLTATGIKETPTDIIGVKLYPNPAKDEVYILMKADEDMQGLSFSIYDATGRQIATQQHATTDITYLLHTSSYTQGIYFVDISKNGKILTTRKFIKN